MSINFGFFYKLYPIGYSLVGFTLQFFINRINNPFA